ncbi:MAG: LysM peptidoglycan-binding domain-containing protein [Candidatus Riflebacteria bacterium]|nr:LysM peptidoglycan-binding domain-containing protein [Candidatus Riflebacteria bacterium]
MKKVALLILAAVLLISVSANAATTHVIKTGDTLWELAAKHYGDPTLYPILLQVNNISNPRTIPNGKVIIIPDKADMKVIANESDPVKRQELIAQANKGKAADKVANKQPASARPDQVSREGEVNPDEVSFTNILNGPKVSADKLIKINTP